LDAERAQRIEFFDALQALIVQFFHVLLLALSAQHSAISSESECQTLIADG
jgi:ABC-type transporter MlaC component